MIRCYFAALGSVFSEFRKFLKTNFRNKKIILWFSKGREMEKGVRIKWEWGEREWFGEKKTTRPRPVTASVSKHFITNISWRIPLYFFSLQSLYLLFPRLFPLWTWELCLILNRNCFDGISKLRKYLSLKIYMSYLWLGKRICWILRNGVFSGD